MVLEIFYISFDTAGNQQCFADRNWLLKVRKGLARSISTNHIFGLKTGSVFGTPHPLTLSKLSFLRTRDFRKPIFTRAIFYLVQYIG